MMPGIPMHLSCFHFFFYSSTINRIGWYTVCITIHIFLRCEIVKYEKVCCYILGCITEYLYISSILYPHIWYPHNGIYESRNDPCPAWPGLGGDQDRAHARFTCSKNSFAFYLSRNNESTTARRTMCEWWEPIHDMNGGHFASFPLFFLSAYDVPLIQLCGIDSIAQLKHLTDANLWYIFLLVWSDTFLLILF